MQLIQYTTKNEYFYSNRPLVEYSDCPWYKGVEWKKLKKKPAWFTKGYLYAKPEVSFQLGCSKIYLYKNILYRILNNEEGYQVLNLNSPYIKEYLNYLSTSIEHRKDIETILHYLEKRGEE